MSSVEILADSLNTATGDRLTTFLLHRFPKCLLAEIGTHRAFSRNAASSRAIPVKKVIQSIKDDPFIPHWTSHRSGMQGGNELTEADKDIATWIWLQSCDEAIKQAQKLIELGVAKQNVNRLLEPWMHVPVLVTATDWDNLWALRCHPAAQPEFRAIAEEMRDAYNESQPIATTPGYWHIPFIAQGELGKAIYDKPFEHYLKVTTARAARCSYINHLGEIDPDKDYVLHDRLLTEQHMSPFEHSAKALPVKVRCRNFSGFMSYRAHIEDGIPLVEEAAA